MPTSTRVKLATCLFLLFIIAVAPGLLMPARIKTYAATTKTGSCGTWHLVSSPNVGGLSVLEAVGGSINNVWAVGYFSDSSFKNTYTLTEHWNGKSWSIISSPNTRSGINLLIGVAQVPKATQAWAVGYSEDIFGNDYALIEYWNGKSWSISPGPKVKGSSVLSSVTAISASNVWAVGYSTQSNGSELTLIEQWNGTSWKIVSSPNAGAGDYLYGVGVASSHDIWSVGDYYNGSIYQPLVELWNGTGWSVDHTPSFTSNASLLGMAVVSLSSAWAVGSYHKNNANLTLIEEAHGTTWGIIPGLSPGSVNNFLYGVSVTPGTNQVWAVGMYQNNGPARTLIESYC